MVRQAVGYAVRRGGDEAVFAGETDLTSGLFGGNPNDRDKGRWRPVPRCGQACALQPATIEDR